MRPAPRGGSLFGSPLLALSLLASALLTLWASPARALPDDTWVIAIGNNRGDAGEVALRYAERDAEQFVQTLSALGGLAPTRTVRLDGRRAEDVRASLDQVDAALRREGGQGSLVVYYSGHADARALHLGGSHLPIAELTERVSNAPGRFRLLIIDACRSGAASRVKGLEATPDFAVKVDDRTRAEGVAIITSSTAGEDSQESDALQASFFSHHLVSGLRGAADENDDARVTLAEAYAYAYAQTLRSSGRTLKLQHPTYRFDLKGKGEVVLTTLESGRFGQLELARPAVYVIARDGEGGPVAAEVAPAREQARLILPAGDYHVQARHPDAYRQYRVTLRDGETTRLADVEPEILRYDQLVRARGGPRRSVHGFMALGGVRGGLLEGEGAGPQAVLGYQADLPWFSVGARARASTVSVAAADDAADRRHDEYALAVTLERFVDFGPLSLSFGLLAEATWHRQTFTGPRPIDPRTSVGGAFGGLLAVERHLPFEWAPGLAVRLEGGPYSGIIEVAEVEDGVVVGAATATPLAGWAALGIRWRL